MGFLVTNNVTKQYANHKALNGVSITVPENSIFGLLGPNGAGKTTLIRIINQITAPDSGEILFNGEKLAAKHIAQIGYLPEERGLYRKMKVGEQAMYLAQLKDVPRKEAFERLRKWFRKFEIEDWWDKKVEELSKGMQQKIQFITTILHEPKLLIFDEPFSGFDPINANLLKEEILNLREQGATVIFSTHNMESVEVLCDYIALINNSNKILDGEVKQIKKDYSTNTFTTQIHHLKEPLKTSIHQDFSVIDETLTDEGIIARIKLNNGATPNDLVKNLTQLGEVHAFNELIPSMNEIFIRTVQENN